MIPNTRISGSRILLPGDLVRHTSAIMPPSSIPTRSAPAVLVATGTTGRTTALLTSTRITRRRTGTRITAAAFVSSQIKMVPFMRIIGTIFYISLLLSYDRRPLFLGSFGSEIVRLGAVSRHTSKSETREDKQRKK